MSRDNAAAGKPLRVFLSYSHRDERYREQLLIHLSLLKRQGVIETWHDRRIDPGAAWNDAISEELGRADLILFLLSADFLASDYLYDVEVKKALEKHERGEARLIPVVLRPCDWRSAPFGRLQALPRDSKPITTWEDLDEAWVDVTRGLRRVIEEMAVQKLAVPPEPKPEEVPQEILWIYDVFKVSGVPTVTFVETKRFGKLRLSIAQPGRGIVVEGPSGIGKTSAIRRALSSLPPGIEERLGGSVTVMSARDPEHVERVRSLPSWHSGTVVIDDAHRLDDKAFKIALDHLKYLADLDERHKKLVLVGIPRTGQSLVDLSFDLATRIDIYRLGRVTDDLVIEMIRNGERALNIRLDRKADIARAAAGSLNVAQALCYGICVKNQVLQTQGNLVEVSCDVDQAIAEVMESLALKFDTAIKAFARLGDPEDWTCIQIIEHLARSNEGFLSIQDTHALAPEVRRKAQKLLTRKIVTEIAEECPDWNNHFYFDERSRALVIDDPQRGFYLRQVSVPRLMREVGKIEAAARRRIFVSYAHVDEAQLVRLRVHLSPLGERVGLELWDDSKIEPGRLWRKELERAIDSSLAAILLVSPDFLASDFVRREELPRVMDASANGRLRILPVLVGACVLDGTALEKIQVVNSVDQPLSLRDRPEQYQVWSGIVRTISGLLG